MKYYFKKFALQKINNEPDPYVWLLYLSYCSIIDVERNGGGDFWDNLKQRIKDFNIEKRTVAKIKSSSLFVLRNLTPISASTTTSFHNSKIKSIQIKNFRGFGPEFNGDDKGTLIDFDSNNTIFYGPNGSGKSSLCDALEYKLTGQVREANRRNRRVTEYIKRIGASLNPSITLSFVDDGINCDALSEDENKYYSQAFIEKNRIQEFSLFGSKDTGIKKEDVLSILIGMDDLSNLAKAFVQPPAFKSNLLSFKRSIVENKITKLNTANNSNLTLKKSYEDTINTEKVKADTLLTITGATVADLDAEQLAIDKAINTINADSLSLSSVNVLFHSRNDYETLLKKLDDNLRKYDDLNAKLVAVKTDVSFSNLYKAVQELRKTVTDKCPACDTPIQNVTTDPFIKADQELVKLSSINELEEEYADQKTIVENNLKSLETIHNDLVTNITSSSDLKKLIIEKTVLHAKSPSYSLLTRNVIDDNITAIKDQITKIDGYFSEVESLNEKQNQKQERLDNNNKKIAKLNERKNSILAIKNNWQTAQTKLEAINLALESFTADLANLNADKISEDNYNSFIDSLIGSYTAFYDQLQSFKDTEFQTRFGNLESEIAGFYTQINKHDVEHEAVETFKINNTNSDYKIEYKVKGATAFEDASIRFSEGHLRSLGLSILLANSKINSLPFVIFDDVVNAIDSDHRANIIEMMANDFYLKGIQQIVSTHDRLYWERFCIVNQKGKFSSYVLKCTKQGVVHYHYNLSFNDKIQHALDHFDIRQALLYSRIWFETIAKQYCMQNNIELSGILKKNEYHVAIEPSLGAIYRVLDSKLQGNNNLKILQRDEINYKGINQEHHSFDEYNFNFIHSRTSHEVQIIFDAVKGLDADIKLINNYETILNEILRDYKYCEDKVRTLNPKMPKEIQIGILQKKADTIKQLIEFPSRMKKLNIDDGLVKKAEAKIKNIIIDQILAVLSRVKGIT